MRYSRVVLKKKTYICESNAFPRHGHASKESNFICVAFCQLLECAGLNSESIRLSRTCGCHLVIADVGETVAISF